MEEIIKYQINKYSKEIDNLLLYAKTNIPFYQNKVLIKENWDKIPIVDKKIIQKNYIAFRSTSINYEYLLKEHTSGTSGNSLELLKDIRVERKKNIALWKKRLSIENNLLKTPLLYFYLNLESKKMNAFVYGENEYLDLSFTYFKTKIGKIIKYNPQWIIGPPTAVTEFSIHCEKLKIIFPKVSYIELYGEILSSKQYDVLKRVYGNAKIVNHYGIREVGSIAISDYDYEKLKLLDNRVVIEILNNKDQPVQAGEKGYITITSLNDFYMPIIRYKTEDVGILSKINNDLFLMIEKGREIVKFKIDNKIISSGYFDTIFSRLEVQIPKCIDNFKIIQDIDEKITIKIVPGLNFSNEIYNFIRNSLKDDFRIDVDFDLVQSLYTEGSRKFIRYKSECMEE